MVEIFGATFGPAALTLPIYTRFERFRSSNVHINNVLLQGTTCVKYLGVLIDSRLDWSSHVQLIKRKLIFACNIFFKYVHFVNLFPLTF